MKNIYDFILQLITMIFTYLSVIIILLFDSVIFGGFVMIINNYILVRLYSIPEITYLDGIGILFLIKIIALMIKSIKINDNINNINK